MVVDGAASALGGGTDSTWGRSARCRTEMAVCAPRTVKGERAGPSRRVRKDIIIIKKNRPKRE